MYWPLETLETSSNIKKDECLTQPNNLAFDSN